jgi:AAA+ superfamily predicted ATPase
MINHYKPILLSFILTLSLGIFSLRAAESTSALPVDQLVAEITGITPQTIPSNIQESKDFTKLVEEQLSITTTLDHILSDLLIQCGNGTIYTKNPEQHIDSISQLRDTIEQTMATVQSKMLVAGSSITQEDFIAIAEFNRTLLNSINQVIAINFAEPITLQLTRSRIDISPEEYAQKNTKNLEAIKKKAESAGLTWYNHIYRAVRPYTVEIATKNSLVLKPLAMTAFILAWAGIYQPTKDDVARSPISIIPGVITLKDNIGEPPLLDGMYIPPPGSTQPVARPVTNTANSSLFGLFHAFLNRVKQPIDPVSTVLLTASTLSLYDSYKEVRPKVVEKLTTLDNFLLGGIHRKQNILSAYKPTTRLKDIVGMENEKAQAEFLINATINPEPFARCGSTPPMTVMCTGESRSGKTYFAEAIAGEIAARTNEDFLFFRVRPCHIAEYGFEGLIAEAKRSNIRVLFIDEFHRYFKAGVSNDLLNGALTALNQQYDPKNPLIIICATNDPKSIPHDLMNRFEQIIRFGKTTLEDRIIYLERELHKSGIKLNEGSLEKLVTETQHCSFETLQRLVKTAKRDALIKHEAVSEKHLWRAFDTEIRGIVFDDNKKLSEAASKVICANIAGEALIQILFEEDLFNEVSVATVLPYKVAIAEATAIEQWWNNTAADMHTYKKYGKVYTRAFSDSVDTYNAQELSLMCHTLVAGYAAEGVLLGNCGYSYRPELREKALKIAIGLVSQGTNLEKVAPEIRAQFERKALELLNCIETETIAILKKFSVELFAIALSLEKQSILYREELLPLLDKEHALEVTKTLMPLLDIDKLLAQTSTEEDMTQQQTDQVAADDPSDEDNE